MRFDQESVYLLSETFKGPDRQIAARALIELLKEGTPTAHQIEEIGASLRRDAADTAANAYRELCRTLRLWV